MIQSLRRLKKEKSLTKDKTIKILHISPHLGGGVGRVLLSYFSKTKQNSKYSHSILCLDTINQDAKIKLEDDEIYYEENASLNINSLLNKISFSDIIIIHWWNHPLLFDLLVRHTLPPCRLTIWSHVSGALTPNSFSQPLLDYPDLFIFTTPISYNYQIIKDYKDKSKLRDIWSTAGLDHIKNIKKTPHEKFIVGYVGTVDFIKMYPNFIDMCSKIDIPDIQFIICGEGSHLDSMREEVQSKGLNTKFIFTGFVKDIQKYLSIFDIFGYPLNKIHYGTCDQVLSEAMGAGIVPVVFNNHMEKNMIEHLYTGFIVTNESSYIETIHKLHKDISLRKKIADNGKKEALKRFSIYKTIKDWEMIFDELIYNNKKVRKWTGKYRGKDASPIEVFFESIADASFIFEEYLDTKDLQFEKKLNKILLNNQGWTTQTKGSPFHYLNFFKNNKELKYLCKTINSRKQNNE